LSSGWASSSLSGTESLGTATYLQFLHLFYFIWSGFCY
jgi:hypothetical protein